MNIKDNDRIKEIKSRIDKVYEYMKDNSLDYYIIFTADPHLSEYVNEPDKFREYLSGFTGSAGTLLIGKEKTYLWVDGRYYIQADDETEGTDIITMHSGETLVPNLIDFLKANTKPGMRIGFDGAYVSEEYYNKICSNLEDIIIENTHCINEKLWPDRLNRIFSSIRCIDESIAGFSPAEKINNLRFQLIKRNSSNEKEYCYFISELTSIMWLLNIRGQDIAHVPVAYSYLMIFADDVILFVSKEALSETVKNHLSENNIRIEDYSKVQNYIEGMNGYNILIDAAGNNSFIFSLLKKNNTITGVSDSSLIRKDIKNPSEIECIRKYHLQDAVSMIRFIMWLKNTVGENLAIINEIDAQNKMDSLRLNNPDCYDLSFDTISAYGENAALPHYSAPLKGAAVINKKGFYLVDSGGQYPQCTTDITRTICLGELTEYERDCYTYVLKGNLRLMNAVFIEGTRGENLDILAREAMWQEGIDFRHGTGHGIGCELSVHEGPLSIRYRIPEGRQQPELKPGMLVSDEPGIYIEGHFGIRLENELLVKEKLTNEYGMFMEFESMTLVPFDLEAINPDLLDPKEKIILNNYHKKVFENIAPLLTTQEVEWLKKNTQAI